MKFATALKLLSEQKFNDNQLFFGHVRIYKKGKLEKSCGVGTMFHDNIHMPYLDDTVIEVVWSCHDNIWTFKLK